MYVDSVILSSIVVVVLTAAVVVYASKFMLNHMRDDIKKHDDEVKEQAQKTS